MRHRTWMVAFALLLALRAAGAAPPTPDQTTAVVDAVKEKNPAAADSGNVRIVGEWGLADERAGQKELGQAVVRLVNGHWVVTAELAGAGQPTVEALTYHEVPEGAINRLLDGRTRDAQKPVMKLLRTMLTTEYPTGYLFENLAIVDNYALCNYRFRESIHKPDHLGQALLRQTGGKWHLVEQGHHPIDLKQYGVPLRIQRTLAGEE